MKNPQLYGMQVDSREASYTEPGNKGESFSKSIYFCSKICISAATEVSQFIQQQTSKASQGGEGKNAYCLCTSTKSWLLREECFMIKALDGDPGDLSLVLVSLTDP